MAQKTATATEDESSGYGYVFIADGDPIITLQTRHGAVGLKAIWERDLDAETEIEVDRRADAGSLPTVNHDVRAGGI